MVYLEYVRARRVFVWFAAVVVVIGAFMVGGALVGNGVNFDMSDSGASGSKAVHVHGLSSLGIVKVPVDALAGLAGVFAIAFATALASSLNRNTQNAHFLFVRPVSRNRMAALTIAVDFAAIFTAALFAFVCALLTAMGTLREHLHFVWDSDTLGVFLLGLGAAAMWYGVLQLCSSWSARRAGNLVSIGVAVLLFAIPLSKAHFLGPLRYVFRAILYVDPLAYFTSVTVGDSGASSVDSALFSGSDVRLIVVWGLAAVALALATFAWKRVEI